MCVCVVIIIQFYITNIAILVTVCLPHFQIYFRNPAHCVTSKRAIRYIRSRVVFLLCVVVWIKLICLCTVIVQHNRLVVFDKPKISKRAVIKFSCGKIYLCRSKANGSLCILNLCFRIGFRFFHPESQKRIRPGCNRNCLGCCRSP